jgi:hypothetical protein
MGILRSTKAGKSAIQITEEHLLDKGWFVKNGAIYPPSEKDKLSHDRYMRFDVINEGGKQIKSFYVVFKKGGSLKGLKYDIQIKTIDDLELLEKFWNSKGRDKVKYRDKLFSRGKEVEHLWFNFIPTYSKSTLFSSPKEFPSTITKVIPEKENIECKPKEYVFDVKLTPIKK